MRRKNEEENISTKYLIITLNKCD